MRDTVVVDGVTLTRAQIQKAMEMLNAPTSTRSQGDVLVTPSGKPRLVLSQRDEWLQGRASKYAALSGSQLIAEQDGVLYIAGTHDTRVGSFAEIVAFFRKAKGL
jgi:hypothetical protein